MTTGKNIALTRRTFVGKVISLLFNKLSRLVAEVRGGGREEQPPVLGAVAARLQEGREELLHSRSGGAVVRRYPHIQGKEQRLRFAEAAVKRYPTSKVGETQLRR